MAFGLHSAGATVDGAALLREVDRRLSPPSYEAYKRINVASVDESGDYLLELKAKIGAVAYDRLRMWVTRKDALPARRFLYMPRPGMMGPSSSRSPVPRRRRRGA
jgi:hypothetical protein